LQKQRLRYRCPPKKQHLTSRSNFFQPEFVVQAAENILDSDPASDWEVRPWNFRSPYWLPTEI
jgi:hypothetical protein